MGREKIQMSEQEKQKEFLNKQLVKIRQKYNKIVTKQTEEYNKLVNKNTPMNSKEQFQTELNKLNLPDNLKAVAFTILDIGLAKLNRLPIRIIQEDKISIKLEYYDSSSSIMYVEGNIYGKYKYCDLESNIGELELEECFSNRANLQLARKLEDIKTERDYNIESWREVNKRWDKLHSYLNSILGLDCREGCITDDDKLILAVKEKIKEDIKDAGMIY